MARTSLNIEFREIIVPPILRRGAVNNLDKKSSVFCRNISMGEFS
jgi:hypothetical protein